MNDLTWHCELVLQNDQDCACAVECFTTHVMNKVYHDTDGNAFTDQRRIRTYFLSRFIGCYVEEITDAGNESSFYNSMTHEIIVGALQEIDFRKIAEDMIGGYSPKSAEAVAESEEFFNMMGFGDYDIDED